MKEDSPDQPFVKKRKPKTRISFTRVLLGVFSIIGIAFFAFWWTCIRMPGESYQASAATAPSSQEANQESQKPAEQLAKTQSDQESESTNSKETDAPKLSVEEEVKSYVVHLANTIGERNLQHYKALCESADYIEEKFKEFGYQPKRQTYKCRGLDCFNIDAEIKGTRNPKEIVIIGGHYDSAFGTPGANDNGSGTAAMLVLANHFKNSKPERTLRFVAWTNEEPPYFQDSERRGEMGSWVYARKCRKEDQNIVAVMSLETMGYYTNEKNSQKYPPPLSLLFPSTGNFVGFVSNVKSSRFQRQVIKTFREHAKVPSEGASLPEVVQGVGWSDHWSFWQEDYVGIMVTDTAPFRYPHYHKKTDTPDKINFLEFAKVIDGLKFVVDDLTKSKADFDDAAKSESASQPQSGANASK